MTHSAGTPRPFVGLSSQPLPFIPVSIRVNAENTGGAFEIYEVGIPTGHVREAAGDGPPPHVHTEHEEAFYVLDGEFTFTLGDERVVAPKEAVVVVPRGTVHGFSGREGSRALVVASPAGLAGFFEELGAGLAAGHANTDLRATLARKYDAHPAAR